MADALATHSKKQRKEGQKAIDDLVRFAGQKLREAKIRNPGNGLKKLITCYVAGDYCDAGLPAFFDDLFRPRNFYSEISAETGVSYRAARLITEQLISAGFITVKTEAGKTIGYDLSKDANDGYFRMNGKR